MKAGQKYKDEIHAILCSVFGAGNVIEEYRFHATRKWRFDFAVPSIKLAVEYNGHGHAGGGHIGRHASIKGMSGDAEKLNQAQSDGWRVVQFTALFFRESERIKNKLTSPLETIRQFANTNTN